MQFIQPDQLIPETYNPIDWNRYSYARGNPIRLNDPTGHWPNWIDSIWNGYSQGWTNFGTAINILQNPNATLSDRVIAGTYANVWGGAHAALAVGTTGIACGLTPVCEAAVGPALGIGTTNAATTVLNATGGDPSDEIKSITQIGRNTGPAVARTLGKTGEILSEITKNTEHIPSWTGKAYRIPDQLLHKERLISEVKNVQKLSYTNQLKDFSRFAQENRYIFELWTRKSTIISQPLQKLIDNKSIIRRFLK